MVWIDGAESKTRTRTKTGLEGKKISRRDEVVKLPFAIVI